jgi:hypothetical protein
VWWYAVVDAAAAGDALARLADSTLRAVTVGPLGLIVSAEEAALVPGGNLALPAEAGVDEELARAAVHHDEIVSGLASLVPALVPIRFGTLADRQELSSLSPATVQRCATLLDRVRGCQEWGLRLMRTREAPQAAQDEGSGAAYLAAIRDRQRARREAAASREDVLAAVQDRLGGLSDAAARLSTRRPGQLASLAYLVRRDRAAEFLDAVQAAGPDLRGCGVEAVVTGPWAPYSFTDLGAAG